MDWQEVAVDGETHFKRLVDIYEELGFEVRLEEVKPEEVEHCTQCLQEKGKAYTESIPEANQKVRNK
jgi:uncharacterized protein YmfQ (DUF2313 family)